MILDLGDGLREGDTTRHRAQGSTTHGWLMPNFLGQIQLSKADYVEAELRPGWETQRTSRPPRTAGRSRAHAAYSRGWRRHNETRNGGKALRKAVGGAVS